MTGPGAAALAISPMSLSVPGLPERTPVETRILYGDLRTGRIAGVLPITGTPSWTREQNDSGGIDGVNVHRAKVRELALRTNAAAARSFLAVEQGDRIRQAGPIWKHKWSRREGRLVLGAGGLLSLFDHRKVLQVLAGGTVVRKVEDLGSVTLTGADLGELARGLVALAMQHVGGDLPLVLPAERPGSARTETFPGGKLYWVGNQIRELTQRQEGAPDVRFTARRRADDPRFIEWVMETGTADKPQLSQIGGDWVFDTTPREGPVLDIEVEHDAHEMGMRGWVTGQGSEEDTLAATYLDPALIDAGYPLLELDESRSGVTENATLDGYARALVARSARPVEVWKLTVAADATLEVLEGDYAQVKIKDDDYLPDGNHRMRVQKIAGSGSMVTLDMYPLLAAV